MALLRADSMFRLPFTRSTRKSSIGSTTRRIETCSTLEYDVHERTAFLLRIAVAADDHQELIEESFETDPPLPLEHGATGVDGNRMVRLVAEPGPLVVRYRGLVEVTQSMADPEGLDESRFTDLPAEVLTYLNPSRYCESDRLLEFAWEEFGHLAPGHARVSTIVDWVHERLSYVPGSTGPSTTATDVLEGREGVCRDYAHLTIALCRALGIPARYVAGYAVDLYPPDFHGFCEIWLDEGWYLFDATKLAPVEGFVRIGTGRDAADVGFATLVGVADSFAPLVSALLVAGETPLGTGSTTADGEAVSTD